MTTIPLTVPVLNYSDFVAADGDVLTTTSLQVAILFGKRHDDLLKSIRTLVRSLPADRLRHFAECSQINDLANGKPRPYFVITRDGFTLLPKSFISKKALPFTLAYLDAFSAMAAHIQNQREGLDYSKARHELTSLTTRRWRGTAATKFMA